MPMCWAGSSWLCHGAFTIEGVVLCGNFYFVCVLLFSLLIASGYCLIKFMTMKYIPVHTQHTLAIALRNIINFYNTHGKFKCLQQLIGGVDMNANVNEKHVENIEVIIHTIKEMFHSIHSSLPYKYLPAQMIVKLISFSNMWLSAFPLKFVIFNPQTITMGTTLDYNKHCRLWCKCQGTWHMSMHLFGTSWFFPRKVQIFKPWHQQGNEMEPMAGTTCIWSCQGPSPTQQTTS